MSTPSEDPKGAAKKDVTSAAVWSGLAAAVAVGLFVYSEKVEPGKKNFYVLGAAVSGILAAVNGYGAWTAYNKLKQPPAAPK